MHVGAHTHRLPLSGPKKLWATIVGEENVVEGSLPLGQTEQGEATGFRGCPLHHPLGGMVGPVEWGSTFFGAGIEVGGI